MDILYGLVLYFLLPLILLSIVVVVHELGHYLAGRATGAAIESFSVGFGKSIYERKDKRGTRWRFNVLPLGGFVAFVGEAGQSGGVSEAEHKNLPGKTFSELSLKSKSFISVAGPVANFIFSIVIFAILLMAYGAQKSDVLVHEVVEGYPAYEAGFQKGDQILKIGGRIVDETSDVIQVASLNANSEIEVLVRRDAVEQTILVTPIREEADNGFGIKVDVGRMGLSVVPSNIRHVPQGPVKALWGGVVQTADVINTTIRVIGRIFTGKESIQLFSGPVGMAHLMGNVVDTHVDYAGQANEVSNWQVFLGLLITLASLTALISVGIGFLNLMPLPVLDGGHIVFYAIEAITNQKVSDKIMQVAYTFGLVAILTLAVFVTFNDIVRTGVFGLFSVAE